MRELLVIADKTFKIKVKDDAKITFGPWSPKGDDNERYSGGVSQRNGTLRIYEGTNVIAVFSGVKSYRDLSLDYSEKIAVEQGATMWRNDERGYERTANTSGRAEWIDDPAKPPRRIAAPAAMRKPASKARKR